MVFVADSSPDRLEDDIESLENLEENLNEIGMSLSSIPWVIQYNKRDVPGCIDRKRLDSELNTWKAPAFEAVATDGKGVYETFEGIAREVFRKLKDELGGDRNVQKKQGEEDEGSDGPRVDPEVVAQGSTAGIDSETGESETSGYAEEREEEHESVSEFVDQVLKEDAENAEPARDLGMEREGYEEYGHMVELGNGDGSGPRAEAGSSVAVAGEVRGETAAAEETEEEEFINDPLVKLAGEKPETAEDAAPMSREESEERPSKLVTVRIDLSEEEIRNEVPVKVVLDIKVHSG